MIAQLSSSSVDATREHTTAKARAEIVESLSLAIRRTSRLARLTCEKAALPTVDSLAISTTQSVHGVDSRLP